ncbi:MAG: hypothetical protein MZV70_43740 [Desulfobacterales bacterium]|nr:hypothetical protein [Desulfobacterales bacterium]
MPHYLKPADIERMASAIGGAKKYALQRFKNDRTLDKRLSQIDPYYEGPDAGAWPRPLASTSRKVIVRGI